MAHGFGLARAPFDASRHRALVLTALRTDKNTSVRAVTAKQARAQSQKPFRSVSFIVHILQGRRTPFSSRRTRSILALLETRTRTRGHGCCGFSTRPAPGRSPRRAALQAVLPLRRPWRRTSRPRVVATTPERSAWLPTARSAWLPTACLSEPTAPTMTPRREACRTAAFQPIGHCRASMSTTARRRRRRRSLVERQRQQTWQCSRHRSYSRLQRCYRSLHDASSQVRRRQWSGRKAPWCRHWTSSGNPSKCGGAAPLSREWWSLARWTPRVSRRRSLPPTRSPTRRRSECPDAMAPLLGTCVGRPLRPEA